MLVFWSYFYLKSFNFVSSNFKYFNYLDFYLLTIELKLIPDFYNLYRIKASTYAKLFSGNNFILHDNTSHTALCFIL